jgi:hypothetical protein
MSVALVMANTKALKKRPIVADSYTKIKNQGLVPPVTTKTKAKSIIVSTKAKSTKLCRRWQRSTFIMYIYG